MAWYLSWLTYMGTADLSIYYFPFALQTTDRSLAFTMDPLNLIRFPDVLGWETLIASY